MSTFPISSNSRDDEEWGDLQDWEIIAYQHVKLPEFEIPKDDRPHDHYCPFCTGDVLVAKDCECGYPTRVFGCEPCRSLVEAQAIAAGKLMLDQSEEG